MDLRVRLDPELESQVREHAAASGKDVVEYIIEAVREKLDSDPAPFRRLSPPEFSAWLDRFTARHADVRSAVDDSRDAIYDDDRGA